MCRAVFCVVVLCLSFFFAASARAATPEEVDAALAKAKKFIYAQQKDDNFEQKMNAPWIQETGHTALAVYALLASGALRGCRPGKNWRVRRADLEAYKAGEGGGR